MARRVRGRNGHELAAGPRGGATESGGGGEARRTAMDIVEDESAGRSGSTAPPASHRSTPFSWWGASYVVLAADASRLRETC